jgi:hypothetical protein
MRDVGAAYDEVLPVPSTSIDVVLANSQYLPRNHHEPAPRVEHVASAELSESSAAVKECLCAHDASELLDFRRPTGSLALRERPRAEPPVVVLAARRSKCARI